MEMGELRIFLLVAAMKENDSQQFLPYIRAERSKSYRLHQHHTEDTYIIIVVVVVGVFVPIQLTKEKRTNRRKENAGSEMNKILHTLTRKYATLFFYFNFVVAIIGALVRRRRSHRPQCRPIALFSFRTSNKSILSTFYCSTLQ